MHSLFCLSRFVPGKLEQAVNLWQLMRAVPDSLQPAPSGNQARIPSSLAQCWWISCGSSGADDPVCQREQTPFFDVSLSTQPTPLPPDLPLSLLASHSPLSKQQALSKEEWVLRDNASDCQQAPEDVRSKTPMLFLGK